MSPGRQPLRMTGTGFSRARCASCHSINSVKALKETQSTDSSQWPDLILPSSTTRLFKEEALVPLHTRSPTPVPELLVKHKWWSRQKPSNDATYGARQHIKHESSKTPPVYCFTVSTSHQDLRSPATTSETFCITP